MEASPQHAEVWQGLRKSIAAGRLAHAYIVVGSPRGDALGFTESFLKLLFCGGNERPCNRCTACRQVDAHSHIDTAWLEPRSKTRQIKADEIRALIQRLSRTSYEGGWKAGIILAADCMNDTAANILLKTLEEPPPRTLLLLVTDAPQSLLPTILSRCQKIVWSDARAAATEAEWLEPLMQILHDLPPAGGLDAARLASRLKGLFDGIRDGIADSVAEELSRDAETLEASKLKEVLDARTRAALKAVQADVFRMMVEWHRDVLLLVSTGAEAHLVFPQEVRQLREQAARHTQASALKATTVIETMARRQERNIPDLQIFDEAFRQMAAGS